MTRRLVAGLVAGGLLFAHAAAPAQAAPPPPTWDGLNIVKAKRLDAVYLAPGADFRTYGKVMLDPTEIAFQKNWQREYNRSSASFSGRLSDADVRSMAEEARTGAGELFAEALSKGGYQVVTEPGPDVLRLRTAVINLSVVVPDRDAGGPVRTYTREAGEGTLVVEVRDSMTGAILGRAVDHGVAGDHTRGSRNRITNRADFSRLLRDWAKLSVEGLNELKALSPVGGDRP